MQKQISQGIKVDPTPEMVTIKAPYTYFIKEKFKCKGI